MKKTVLIFVLFAYQLFGGSFSREVKKEIALLLKAKMTLEEKSTFLDSLIKSDFFLQYDSTFFYYQHVLSKTNSEKEDVLFKLIDKEFIGSSECFKSLLKLKVHIYSTSYFSDLYKEKRLKSVEIVRSAASILSKYKKMNADLDSTYAHICLDKSNEYIEQYEAIKTFVLENKYSCWISILDVFHTEYYSKEYSESDTAITMIDRIRHLEQELSEDMYQSDKVTIKVNELKAIYTKKKLKPEDNKQKQEKLYESE